MFFLGLLMVTNFLNLNTFKTKTNFTGIAVNVLNYMSIFFFNNNNVNEEDL